MSNKGAISLVVTDKAFDQLRKLEKDLIDIEQTIIRISSKAIGSKGSFSGINSQKQLNLELKKQSNILIQIAKNNKKYSDTLNKTISKQKQLTKATKASSKATSNLSSRFGSFFKTLVAFDVARRGVEAFWGAFAKAFQTIKALDSLSLQLKYLVKDTQEILITQGFLSRISEELGVNILKLSESYIAFRKSAELANLSANDTRLVFEEVTKAASILGKSDAEIKNVQVALEQMLSKGTVQAEELKKQLGNVLPGSFEIMAKAVQELNPDLVVTNREFGRMLKRGEIIAAEVLPEFARQLTKAYGVDNIKRINTMQSEIVRLDNSFTIMVRNMEAGSGSIAKAILFVTSVTTDLVTQFGELFLTVDELVSINKKLNFEKGFKEATNVVNEFRKQYGDTVDELRTPIGWQVQYELEDLSKMKAELSDLEAILAGAESRGIIEGWFDGVDIGLTTERVKQLSQAIGKSEGFIAGMTAALTENKNAINDVVEEVEDLTKVYNGLIPILERAKKALLEIQKDETDAVKILELSKSMDALSKSVKFLETGDMFLLKDLTDEQLEPLLENLRKTNPELAYLIKNLREMGNIEIDGIEGFKEVEEQIKGLTDKEKMMIDVLDASADSLNSLADTINNIFEKRVVDLEYEMDKIQEKYDLQKELIESEIIDEESKAERLRQLQKEKEINEKVIQKKIAKEKEKQFRIDQAAAIATVGIQTAIGIISNLAAFPGPVGIALAALVAATGIASTVAIASEPVPKFKDGHLAGTHSGLAIINDGGVPEVVQRKDGGLEMSSVRNKMISMQKGDKVHKSFDSFTDQLQGSSMMDKLNQASIMASVNISKHALDGVKADRQFQESLKGVLSSEIKKGFDKVNIRNDNSSVARAVAQAIDDAKYENNFL